MLDHNAKVGSMFQGLSYAEVIPSHTLEQIDAYVARGQAPGSFLYAVLIGDLKGVITHGDTENLTALVAICKYIYNQAPWGCHSSPDHVSDWMDEGGLKGINR